MGNWKISDEGIEWNGKGFSRFVIPKNKLAKIRQEDRPYYEWILLATAEDWLTQNDLYDLNYAFVYAAAKFGSDFDYEVFDNTLEKQFEQFDLEDADDDEC